MTTSYQNILPGFATGYNLNWHVKIQGNTAQGRPLLTISLVLRIILDTFELCSFLTQAHPYKSLLMNIQDHTLFNYPTVSWWSVVLFGCKFATNVNKGTRKNEVAVGIEPTTSSTMNQHATECLK